MSLGYIRALGVTISRLTAFEALKGKKYTFADITEEWGNSYLTYLRYDHINEKADKDENNKKETGLGENSICKDIKNLKTFMMQGVRDKVHANLDFKQIPAISQEADNIRLTPDEVKAILDLDLTDHPHLVKERDRFSLAYNFLLRFSDSIRVDPKFIVMVEGKPYLDMMTEKTKSRVVIPIKERNYTFLKENNYKIATANSTSNDNLKQLGWLANILEPVTITEFRKGKIQTKQYRKFELITTHTTRRSAATNLYLEGADLERIRIMGGWSNLKQLQTYIRLDKLEAAKALSSMKFFE
jgi:site-specific recombinase XerD